jgi:hypothetical protein
LPLLLSECSPSYALRAGLSAISSNSELETGLIELALLRGCERLWTASAAVRSAARS